MPFATRAPRPWRSQSACATAAAATAAAQEAQFTEQGNQVRTRPQALTRMVIGAGAGDAGRRCGAQ